uniref:Uncharacterized protein n=1 Tax=Tanacetum cinerariifolium TaxID=118510 RepID=A0A6L2LJ98_TANCI|nr:hypothetical protein [Tanacetum cinerariifolium]
MKNSKDISNLATAFDMALVLMAKAFTLNDTTLTNNNQRSSSNSSNMQIAQPGMNMDQDRQMLMVKDNNGLSVVLGIANQHGNGIVIAARAEGNSNEINGNQLRCYNGRGEGHYASNCTVKPRKWNAVYLQQHLQIAQEEEAGIQSTQEEFKFMAAADASEETERVKANCILENNLQQASTSGTQSDKALVYDSNRSAEVQLSKNCYDNDIFNMFTQRKQYNELLEPIPEPHQVPHNDSNVISKVSSVEQGGETVEQHLANVEETRVLYDSLYNTLAIKVEKVNSVDRKLRETNADLTTELARYKNQENCFEIGQENITNSKGVIKKAAKFIQDFKSLAKEADESIAKQKALELEIKCLLRAVVSQDIMSVVQNNFVIDTLNLQTELERIFMINHFKASRVDNFVPNKHVQARVRKKPITISQPHVITKNDVNSKTNSFSPKDIKRTTRTRRLRSRNNPKHDKVPSKSKSSRLLNNLDKIEENHRNLQSFLNKKHMSSECNNIKVAIRNAKSEVVCAMCKQCLITVNHDVCVLNYVNGMNSRGKKQKQNVSNQKKHKAQVWKSNNVGSKERLASLKPSTPKSCLRWSPTGRIFDLKGKIISWKVYSVICLTNYSDGENQVVSKSFAVTTADASDKCQQQQDSTSSTSTLATTITVDGNFDLLTLFSIHGDEWNSFQSQHQTAPRGSNILSWKPCQGGSYKLNLPDHKYSIHTVKWFSRNRRIRRRCYNLIPAESTFKTSCSIDKDEYMMKAYIHVSGSSAISDVQVLPQKNVIDNISEQ